MNNKGQTLVVFVILLPLLLMFMAWIYDIGSLEIKKQKISTDVKSAITYGLKNIDKPDVKSKIENMLDQNIEGEKTVAVADGMITVTVKTTNESIFPNIIKDKYDINLHYSGHIDSNKKIIIQE